MCLTLIFLVFIGSCLAGIFGKYLGARGSAFITVLCLFICFVLSLLVFYEVSLLNCPVFIKLSIWFNLGTLNVDWGFIFDSLTSSMLLIVSFISLLVHLYSIEYMAMDPHFSRFMAYLSLFTFFMFILVSADNFIQLFIGWEGVGLCSYLLVNFWFTWIQANKAAIKAMLVNWIGDFGLLTGILLIFNYFNATDYSSIFLITPLFSKTVIHFLNISVDLLTVISYFLFIGAIGKSAQIGLHTWLPDAMEGPTPVSALIHAATMVTAGVFLIVWSSPIYENALNVLEIVCVLGSITAFFAASVGLIQNDLKRTIAYSTASQLGYMFFSCGLSQYYVGFFHLANHAYFKALLFLSAGSVIHSINDNQDSWKMGGLKRLVPFTYVAIITGSIALIGFPFLTGFYSKDLILEISYSKYTLFGYTSYLLGTVSAFFTAFYSMRLTCLGFLTKPSGYKQIICFTYDSGSFICIALTFLCFFSIFVGYLSKDYFVGIGNNFYNSTVYIKLNHYNLPDSEFIKQTFKFLPLLLSFCGLFIAFIFFIFKPLFLFVFKQSWIGQKFYYFLNRKWFIDKIYIEYCAQNFFKFSYSSSYKIIDRGFIEIFGPTGFCHNALKIGSSLHTVQTNFIYHYTLIVLVGVTLFFGLFKIWVWLKLFIDYRLCLILFLIGFFKFSSKLN